MQLHVIRRPGAQANLKKLEAGGAKSDRIDQVSWIRSYVVHEADGRTGTLCIYEARDADTSREHADRAGMPGEAFYRTTSTVIVRSDPPETQAAVIAASRNEPTGAARHVPTSAPDRARTAS
jgi:hypothetical protein